MWGARHKGQRLDHKRLQDTWHHLNQRRVRDKQVRISTGEETDDVPNRVIFQSKSVLRLALWRSNGRCGLRN